uniref:Uncharacterized protein n=1 Tax=Cacopsylla melanoneura TaxID=428564 RepID=A0A8D9FC64_9HEMI
MESVELNPMTNTLQKESFRCMNEEHIFGDPDSSPKPPSFIEQKSVSCNELRDSLQDTDDEKKNRPESKTKAMQKLKSSWLTGTKNLKKETASLLSTVGTWTNTILKHDKTSTPSTEEQEKYFGLVEKKGHLAQKMKTLLKIGEEGKVSGVEKDTVSVVSQDSDRGSN